ncbi:unnamed protein product [Sphagnum balticum]
MAVSFALPCRPNLRLPNPDCDSDSYRVWDPYWGFIAIMTTGDSATALAITIYSHTPSAAEILTTEFVACQIVANIAWQDNSTQSDFERRAKEDMDRGSKSARRRLPVSCNLFFITM